MTTYWIFFDRFSKINRISVVKSILNAISSIESKDEFVVELVKACNGMIDQKDRNKFTNTVGIEMVAFATFCKYFFNLRSLTLTISTSPIPWVPNMFTTTNSGT